MINKEDIVKFMQTEFPKIGGKTAIIGVSGGKDSTVVIALCIRAFGKSNVVPVLLPNMVCYENNCISDNTLGYKICKYYGYDDVLSISVEDIYSQMTSSLTDAFKRCGIIINPYVDMSILPRLRTTLLYSIAKQYDGGRVINTSNYSEYVLGWFTRYGDSAGDIKPLINLYVSDVLELGKQLEVPLSFLSEPPRDDLTGKTDEQNFGFTYDDLENFMKGRPCKYADAIGYMIESSKWKHVEAPSYKP